MKKVFKIILLIIIVFLLLLYVALPVTLGFISTLKYNKKTPNMPSYMNSVNIKTDDNVNLSAWYLEPKNGALVILLHGASSSKEALIKHIEMLSEKDYGVLAFDFRGHGESTGDGANLFNWDSEKDIDAVIEYLNEKNIKNIGALGLSLGGEAILSYAYNNNISAIVSEGASERSIKDYVELDENKPLIRNYFTKLMYLSAGFFSGRKEPISIKESIVNSTSVKFLLIGSKKISKEIKYNEYYKTLIPNDIDLWLIDDCSHTDGINHLKEEYYSRVINFFDENLLGN